MSMSGFKISLATAFRLSLIIPFLIKPVNEFSDTFELKIKSYCFQHADRAAQGENVVNDPVKSRLVNNLINYSSCGNKEFYNR
jgi:hypothetical protein